MFTSYFNIIYGKFFFFFEQYPKYITYATAILLMSDKWVVHKQFGKNLKIMIHDLISGLGRLNHWFGLYFLAQKQNIGLWLDPWSFLVYNQIEQCLTTNQILRPALWPGQCHFVGFEKVLYIFCVRCLTLYILSMKCTIYKRRKKNSLY